MVASITLPLHSTQHFPRSTRGASKLGKKYRLYTRLFYPGTNRHNNQPYRFEHDRRLL